MSQSEIDDPIRVILRDIVDITFDIVTSLKQEGKHTEANLLILWVAECLHGILIRKLRFHQLKPFTPDQVRNRYNAIRDKTGFKTKVRKQIREE